MSRRSIWRTPVRDLWRSVWGSEAAPAASPDASASGASPVPVHESRTRLRERTLDTPPGAYWDGYRSLSWRQRDLSPVTHDMMISGVEWLYASSPIARRALEIQRDFVVSQGFKLTPTTTNPAWAERIQAVIDAHWNDPVNAWTERVGQRVIELAMFGEWTMHVSVRKRDGRVRLGMLVPEIVAKIEADPLNAEDLRTIVLKGKLQVGIDPATGKPVEAERLRIIRRVEDPRDDNFDTFEGEVFHLAINRLSTASRGLSDLLPIIDWLDLFHQLTHSEVDRAMMLKAFCWDVTYDNATPGEIEECIERNQAPPSPGSVNVHSAKETWTAISPDLKIADIMEMLRFLLLLCLGSIGIPEHFFVEANTVNKASAGEMSSPVFARIRERQNVVCSYIGRILEFVVEQAWKAGVLADVPRSELGVSVTTIDPDRKQFDTLAAAMSTMADFLGKGVQAGWVTNEEAALAFRDVCDLAGFELPEDLPETVAHPPAQQAPAPQQATAATMEAYLRGKRDVLGRA